MRINSANEFDSIVECNSANGFDNIVECISLRRLILNPTYKCCVSIKRHIMLYNIYS